MRFHAGDLPPHGEHRFPLWAWVMAGAAALLMVGGLLALTFRPARVKPPPRSAEMLEIPILYPDLARVSDELVESIILIESGGNPRRVGLVGERGLMQIRSGTWREVTRKHLGRELSFDLAFDPEWNRRVGRLYLAELQAFLYKNRSAWKSDPRSLLLAAYNAGPERVRRAGFDLRRLPASVRDYAARGSALHDSRLDPEEAEALRQLLEKAKP